MGRATAVAIAILAAVWPTSVRAQPAPQMPPGDESPPPAFTIGVAVGPRLGNTTYGLKYTEYVPDASSDVTAESRLNWPADYVMVGAHARWNLGGRYALTVTASTNVHAPLGEMDDSDWIAAPGAGVPRTKFAYTESMTKARALVADVGLRAVGDARWNLLGGYHHEYYQGDAWGADGWFDTGGGRNDIAIPDDVLGIHFESHRFMPYAGARFRNLYEGRVFGVYTHDYDDHVLRFKDGTGRSFGVGLSAAAHPRWKTGSRTIGFDLELQYVRAHWGTLEQAFYADDPATAEDERTVSIPDSDYLASSLHVSALFVAELGL